MAKFPERNSQEEESSSWLYTALGMAIILCVVGFIGLAKPGGIKSEPDLQTNEIPKFQPSETVKIEQPVVVESNTAAKNMNTVKSETPVQIQLSAFPANVLEDQGLFIKLPFGGDAREKCNQSCNGESLCMQSCSRLLPAEFARRILPKELEHEKLAGESLKSCLNASFTNPISGAQRAELKTFLTPVEYYDESEIGRKIAEASYVMQNLTSMKEADPLAEAVCYYQGSLVAALATANAAKVKDSVSEVAYRGYEMTFTRELQRKLQEIRG